MTKSFTRVAYAYVGSAIAIFLFAAYAKITSSYPENQLDLPDPFLVFLSSRNLIYIAVGIEVVSSCFLAYIIRRTPDLAVKVTLWISLLFAIYKTGFGYTPSISK